MDDLRSLQEAAERTMLVAFFDLTRYARATKGYDTRQLFALMSDYYEWVGERIEGAGGIVVKFIGDAALVVFSQQRVDAGLLALLALKEEGDRWLGQRGLRCEHIVKAHFGPVTCGPIGTQSDKRFDVFGETVNIAATLRSNGIACTPQLFRTLAPETRKHLKKHTPPIVYIPVDERHRD
jgi:class 3 adenylate cyclase